MASADLSWLIVRNSSSFLLKRNRQNLTLEPNNLKGRNSFRFSGLVQKRTVGVEPAKDGKGVVLITKKVTGSRKPGKNINRVELKRDSRRTFRAIRNITRKSGYRKDLSMAAVRRAAAIIKSQRPVVPRKTGRAKKD
ncbi:large ribosomal subunit protein eL28-like [Babylonia areolata]|uniref:large ribosomal subunit protein eL28-like n=1 Tax=Babylonia areolata TaxID=304850 RepID=UPI003FCF1AC2